MTYQQKFEELYKDFLKKSETYLASEMALSKTHGWGDMVELSEYSKEKKEWQEAGNNYHDFISFSLKNGKLPNDLFS